MRIEYSLNTRKGRKIKCKINICMISHLTLDSYFTIQVCDDIDECKGPNNGGCTANSVCHNSVVRLLYMLSGDLDNNLICANFYLLSK